MATLEVIQPAGVLPAFPPDRELDIKGYLDHLARVQSQLQLAAQWLARTCDAMGPGPHAVRLSLVERDRALMLHLSRLGGSASEQTHELSPCWRPGWQYGMDPMLEWQCLYAFHAQLHQALYLMLPDLFVTAGSAWPVTIEHWLQHPETPGEGGHLLITRA